ncbi:hypothetical protein Y032_0025g1109 [Ancylostoma ceylanicum]|uniref:Uncharacterized protein n=1 Tax=Ancylostoma ceylanicum TaxID=53326 RepID=A0A016UVK8_9BILA|nr:hypothetical protein Y032_0025g1109 [Ancylostoma ceylanicum]
MFIGSRGPTRMHGCGLPGRTWRQTGESQRNGILLVFQQNNAAIHDGRSKMVCGQQFDCYGFSYLPGLLL